MFAKLLAWVPLLVYAGTGLAFAPRLRLSTQRIRRLHSSFSTYCDSDDEFWKDFPAMSNMDIYASSVSLNQTDTGKEGDFMAWRQDAGKIEVWIPLSEDTKVKRDVSVVIGKRSLTLTVAKPCGGSPFVSLSDAPLAHPVLADESSWIVISDDIENSVSNRWLLLTLAKESAYMNWISPIASPSIDSKADGSADSGIIIGAGERDQRALTAQQLASYQRLRATPYTTHVDVYIRRTDEYGSEQENSWEQCWYVGKVAAAEGVSNMAAIEAQAPLIVGHARLLLPSVFGDAPTYTNSVDSRRVVSLWFAPGDSELQVAQDQIPLHPVSRASSHDRSMVPESAIDVGFDHESHAPDEKGFFCRRDANGEPLGDAVQVNFAPPSSIPEFRVGEIV